MLTNPVANLHMIRMSVFRKAGGFGLFGREKALLVLGDLIEPLKRF